MKAGKLLAGMLFILALVVTSCGPAAAPTTAPAAPEATKEEVNEPTGTVTIGMSSNWGRRDNHVSVWQKDLTYHTAVFDTLVGRDEDNKYYPLLAESWESSSPTEWVFKLRKGIKFHNGEPFDAEAVKASVLDARDRNKDPMFGTFSDAQVIDPYTVKVITKEPDPLLLGRMSNLFIWAPKYASEVGPEEFVKKPIGTGPFKFVKLVKDSYTTLEANTEYWRGAPHFKTLAMKVIPETATRVASLKAGETDIIISLPAEQVDVLNASTDLKAVAKTGPRPMFIMMYPGSPQLGGQEIEDVRVRQALNYAVNVESIIKNILGGHAYRISTIVLSSMVGFDPNLEPYSYDPDKAKELLAEAGYADGFDLVIEVGAGRYIKGEEVVEAVAADLQKVGIRAEVHRTEYGTLIKERNQKTVAPLFLFSWGTILPDASIVPRAVLYPGGPGTMYSSPELVKLLDEAAVDMNPESRNATLARFQAQLKEEAPFIFLYEQEELWGVNKRIDFNPRSDGVIMLWGTTVRE